MTAILSWLFIAFPTTTAFSCAYEHHENGHSYRKGQSGMPPGSMHNTHSPWWLPCRMWELDPGQVSASPPQEAPQRTKQDSRQSRALLKKAVFAEKYLQHAYHRPRLCTIPTAQERRDLDKAI